MTKREIELIQSSIDNGRIYFSIDDIKFFPTDSLSDRESGGHEGKDVTFIAGGKEFIGPIRISSGQRVSPRRSFGSYLKSCGAKAGDRLIVTRTGEREYQVDFARR